MFYPLAVTLAASSSVTFASAALQSSSDDGLTLREIVSSLPTDPASVVTIVLLAASAALVVWAGKRPRGKGGRPA